MPRTGRYYKGGRGGGIPSGWCARLPEKFSGKGAGLKMSDADARSLRVQFYKKFPVKPQKGARGATLGATYGCPKGSWHPAGRKGRGSCDTGMRVVRLMKPKALVAKSKHRSAYKCKK